MRASLLAGRSCPPDATAACRLATRGNPDRAITLLRLRRVNTVKWGARSSIGDVGPPGSNTFLNGNVVGENPLCASHCIDASGPIGALCFGAVSLLPPDAI